MFGLRSCVVFITAASCLYLVVAFAALLTFSSVVALPNPVRDEVHVESVMGYGLTSRLGFPVMPTAVDLEDIVIKVLSSEIDETLPINRCLLCCPIAFAAFSYFWKFLQNRRKYTKAGVRELREQASTITDEYKHVLLRLSKAKLLLKAAKKCRKGPVSSKIRRGCRNQQRKQATGRTSRRRPPCTSMTRHKPNSRHLESSHSGMKTDIGQFDQPHFSTVFSPIPADKVIPTLLMPNGDSGKPVNRVSIVKRDDSSESSRTNDSTIGEKFQQHGEVLMLEESTDISTANVMGSCSNLDSKSHSFESLKQVGKINATSTPKPKCSALLGNENVDTGSFNAGHSDNVYRGMHELEDLGNGRASPILPGRVRTVEGMQESGDPSVENQWAAVQQPLTPTGSKVSDSTVLPSTVGLNHTDGNSTSNTSLASADEDNLLVLYQDVSLHKVHNQCIPLTKSKMKELGFQPSSSEAEDGCAMSGRTSSTDSFWPGSSDSSSYAAGFSNETRRTDAAKYHTTTSSSQGDQDATSWPEVETRGKRVVQEEISDDAVPMKKITRPGAAMMDRLESNRNQAALKGPQPIAGCLAASSDSVGVDISSGSLSSSPVYSRCTASAEMSALQMRGRRLQSDDSYISTPSLASESGDSEFVASHSSASVSTGGTEPSDFEIDFRDGSGESDVVTRADGQLMEPSGSPWPEGSKPIVPPIKIPTGSFASSGTSPGDWIPEYGVVDELALRHGTKPGEAECSRPTPSKTPFTPENVPSEDPSCDSASDICGALHYPVGLIAPYECDRVQPNDPSNTSVSRPSEKITSVVGDQMSVDQIREELSAMENTERQNLKREMENAKCLVMKDLNEERDMIIEQIKDREAKANCSLRARLVNCFRPRRRVLNQLRERLKAVEIATEAIQKRSNLWNETLQQVEEEKRARERSSCRVNVDRIRQYEQAIVVCAQKAMALRKVFQGKWGTRSSEQPHCYDCCIGRHSRLGASPKPRPYKRFHDDFEPHVHTPLLREKDGFPSTCPIVQSINSRYEALNMTEYVPLDVKVLRISKMQKKLQWDLFRRPYLIDGQLPRC